MARVSRSVTSKKRKKKILKMASGYRGRNNNVYKVARERVEKGLQYAYRDRKVKKRTFRSLWIQRINAAVRELGLKYSEFINILKQKNINLDRKVLANMAHQESEVFKTFVQSLIK